jgi:hypothetical protein
VLRYLAEEGYITHEGGRWHRAGDTPPEMHIPEGLRDVIGKRLSRLSPDCNRILTTAAVIGRDFALETLRAVGGVEDEPITQALEEAVHIGVLEEQARPGRISYRFAHAFFRQTLYEELIAPRRLRLHQEVARAMERQYAARLDEHAAELAEHFSQSTDPLDLAKAVKYGELAARRAIAVYAYAEAARHLERALQVQEVVDPDDRARRSDLLALLGDALMSAGEPQRVAEAITPDLLALAEELGDRVRASDACRMALTALERYGGVGARATPQYRRWAEKADEHAAPSTVHRVLADVARFYAAGLGSPGRRDYAARALELGRRLGTAEALFAAGQLAIEPDSPLGIDERRQVAQELAAAPRQGIGLFTLGRTLYLIGVALFNFGDRAAAERLWSELEEIGTRTQDTYVLLRAPFIAAVRATLDGRLEDALAAAQLLKERADELGSAGFGRLWSKNLSAVPLNYLGRAAEHMDDVSESEIAPANQRYLVGLAHTGRIAECRKLLDEARSSPKWRDAASLPYALEAAVLLQDAELAAVFAQQLAALVPPDFLTNPENSCVCAGRLLGAAAVLAGDLDQAEDYTRQAIGACERARFRPELALTRLQLAEILSARTTDRQGDASERLHQEALAHLDFAIEEFRAMKMQPSLERALRHKGLLHA